MDEVGQRARKVGRVERELTTRLGREPTNEEIAREAELDLVLVLEVKAANRAVTSLDQPVGEDGDTSMGDLLPAQQAAPEEEVAGTISESTVARVVADLPGSERRVVELRFGLGGSAPTPLRETGERLGLSAERVRQIEERALERLSDEPELAALRDAA